VLAKNAKGRLLRHFGSIQRVANASVSELLPFVGRKTAEEIAAILARKEPSSATGHPQSSRALTRSLESESWSLGSPKAEVSCGFFSILIFHYNLQQLRNAGISYPLNRAK